MKCNLVVLLTLLYSINSNALVIEYSGVVTEPYGSITSHPLYDKVEMGDIITGSFSYDPEGVNDINSSDATGQYLFGRTNSLFTLSILDASESNSILYSYSGYISMIVTENNWRYTPNHLYLEQLTAIRCLGDWITGRKLEFILKIGTLI